MLPSLLLLPLMLASVSARFVNVTIDDTHGDSRTGLIPAYSPEGRWNAICPGCGSVDVPLDWAHVEQRTIHDAAVNSTIGNANVMLNFNGSAIYVFFAILPMFDMEIEFYLDSSPRPAETLLWFANTTATDVIYDHLVFKSGTLTSDAEHTLLISCAQEGNFGTIALFDYALYTVEDADPVHQTPAQTSGPRRSDSHEPSMAKKGIIAGAVVGAAAVLAVVARYLLRRRQHRAGASDGGDEGDTTVVPFPGPAAPSESAPLPKDSKLYYRDAISPFRAGSSSSRTGSSHRSPKDGKSVHSAAARAHETEDAPSADAAGETSPGESAYLRAELLRMHAENAMLRQVSEPPPYDPRTALDA